MDKKYNMIKIQDKIKIERKINFSELFPSMKDIDSAKNDYHLYGEIVHAGETAETGHYYTIMREDVTKDNWYIFNDKDVFKKTENNYLTE